MDILKQLDEIDSVKVLRDHRPNFDQESLANDGIQLLASLGNNIEWVMSLDVDEFLVADAGLIQFLNDIQQSGLIYGSIRLMNNIPIHSWEASNTNPEYLRTTTFYLPKPERTWQEPGQLAKAIFRVHEGMRIAVGNHYVYHEPLQQAFTGAPFSPVNIGPEKAVLLHYEMRDAGKGLLQKWRNLAERHRVPGSDPKPPQWEKEIKKMLQTAKRFENDPRGLYDFVVNERRTLWGTQIGHDQICEYTAVAKAVSQ